MSTETGSVHFKQHLVDCVTYHIFHFDHDCWPSEDYSVEKDMLTLAKSLPSFYRQLRSDAPKAAQIIVVGYPRMFPEGGVDGCFLQTTFPKDDQNWANGVVDDLDYLIETQAKAAGLQYLQGSENSSQGHELCTGSSSWFNPIVFDPSAGFGNYYASSGSFHPRAGWHSQIAQLIAAQMGQAPRWNNTIYPGDHLQLTAPVANGSAQMTFSSRWPGSDVQMTLISPSGRVIDRNTQASDVIHNAGGTFEVYTVLNPEPGTWTADLYGADVDYAGEQVLTDFTTVADTTPPDITSNITGTLGLNNWYVSPVTIDWNVLDTQSIITTSTGCDGTLFSADTASATSTCSATSLGGTSSQSVTVKIDQTPPVLNVTGAPDGTIFNFCNGAPARPSFAPTDAMSGLDGTQGDSWVVPTTATGAGTYTYSAHATDNAGNNSSETRTYQLQYGAAFGGLTPPIGRTNPYKLGSTVPVKFQLMCGKTPITNAVAKIVVKPADGSTTPGPNRGISSDSTVTDNTFRYDPKASQYIFNLSTKSGFVKPDGSVGSYTLGVWTLSIMLDDGTSRSVNVQLTS